MGLRYRIPLPDSFYYSGRAGPGRWLPRGSNTGTGSGYHACSVLWSVLGDSSFAAKPSEVPAGRPAFLRSVASAAAAGSAPRPEAVRLRSGPTGARGC